MTQTGRLISTLLAWGCLLALLAGACASTFEPAFQLSGEVEGPLGGSQRNPAGAWSGGQFLVVWDDARGGDKDVYGMRLGGDGVPLDPGGLQITGAAGSQRQPAIAPMADGQFLVAWEDRSSGRLMGNVVTADGAVRYADDFVIAGEEGGTSRSKDIELSASPAGILAVWEQHSPGGTYLLARVLDAATGQPDPDFPVKRVTEQSSVTEPSVASSGERFYVVWEDEAEDRLFGVLIDPKDWAVELPEATFLGEFDNAGGDAEVVGGPAGFRIAWLKQFWDGFNPEEPANSLSVEVAQVTVDGAVSHLHSSSSMLVADQCTSRVSLALGRLEDDRYLLVWQHESGGRSVLKGVEYTTTGGFVSRPTILAERFSGAQDPELILADGRSLLLWEDRRHDFGTDENEEIFARFSPAGGFAQLGVEKLLTVARDTPVRTPIAVGTDGDGYFVVWRSESGQIADGLYGAHLGADGKLSPPFGHLIAGGVTHAAIASDGDGYLIAWSGGQALGFSSVPSRPDALWQMRSRLAGRATNAGSAVALASDGASYVGAWTAPAAEAGMSLLMAFSVADESDLDAVSAHSMGTLTGTGNPVAVSGGGGQFAIFSVEPGGRATESDINVRRVRTLVGRGVVAVDTEAVAVEDGVRVMPGLGIRAVAVGGEHRYHWTDRDLRVRSRLFSFEGGAEMVGVVESHAGEVAVPIAAAIADDGADTWVVSAWAIADRCRLRVSRLVVDGGGESRRYAEGQLDFGGMPLGVAAAHDGSSLLLLTASAESSPGTGDARLVGYRLSLGAPQLRIERIPSGHRVKIYGAVSRSYRLQSSKDLQSWSEGVIVTTDENGEASIVVPAAPSGHRWFRADSDFK